MNLKLAGNPLCLLPENKNKLSYIDFVKSLCDRDLEKAKIMHEKKQLERTPCKVFGVPLQNLMVQEYELNPSIPLPRILPLCLNFTYCHGSPFYSPPSSSVSLLYSQFSLSLSFPPEYFTILSIYPTKEIHQFRPILWWAFGKARDIIIFICRKRVGFFSSINKRFCWIHF